MNELITLESTELQGIELSKAKQIKAVFDPMTEMLMKFEDDFNTIIEESKVEITKEITAKAKRLRIDIGRVRIATEKTRKEQKEEYLRAGKAIDSVANIVKWVVTDKEEKLEKIEKHYELLEQQRIEKLQTERAEELQQYVDAVPSDLGTMKDDVWQAYIDTKKRQYEERIEAEKKAEEERVERERRIALHRERKESIIHLWQFVEVKDEEFSGISEEDWKVFVGTLEAAKKEYDSEQERIRVENERLKKEAEEKRKADEIERKKREEEDRKRHEKEAAERKSAEEKARKEREAYEAKLKEERDEREKIERAERAKREAVERELAERKAVEERKASEEKARIQAELNKGDSDKVKDLIIDLESLKTKYQFKSEKNRKMYSGVSELIDKVILFINR
jgi:hypothetical protein